MRCVPESTLQLPAQPPATVASIAARHRPEPSEKGSSQGAATTTPRVLRKDPLPLN
jgi:hypothetical protein